MAAPMNDVQALTVALKLTSSYEPGEASRHAREIVEALQVGGWVIALRADVAEALLERDVLAALDAAVDEPIPPRPAA